MHEHTYIYAHTHMCTLYSECVADSVTVYVDVQQTPV